MGGKKKPKQKDQANDKNNGNKRVNKKPKNDKENEESDWVDEEPNENVQNNTRSKDKKKGKTNTDNSKKLFGDNFDGNLKRKNNEKDKKSKDRQEKKDKELQDQIDGAIQNPMLRMHILTQIRSDNSTYNHSIPKANFSSMVKDIMAKIESELRQDDVDPDTFVAKRSSAQSSTKKRVSLSQPSQNKRSSLNEGGNVVKFRFQKKALFMIHCSLEDFMTQYFYWVNRMALHGKRQTIQLKDMAIVTEINDLLSKL